MSNIEAEDAALIDHLKERALVHEAIPRAQAVLATLANKQAVNGELNAKLADLKAQLADGKQELADYLKAAAERFRAAQAEFQKTSDWLSCLVAIDAAKTEAVAISIEINKQNEMRRKIVTDQNAYLKAVSILQPELYVKLEKLPDHHVYGEAELADIWAQTEPVEVPAYEPLDAGITIKWHRDAETLAKFAKKTGDQAAKLELLP